MFENWNSINWIKVTNTVNNLQTKIFEASKLGNIQQVHIYQNTMINMYEAKLLAVRKVTQDNRERRTAGIDGIKILNSKAWIEIVNKLRIDGKASPIRKIWIPKPGKSEKRALGIPTMEDRIKQMVVKLALEPQWEAKFEPNSYGFRPGRSPIDAAMTAYKCLWDGERFILNGDIRKCFDTISHEKLLNKIQSTKSIQKQIHAWLKAGIIDPDHTTEFSENSQVIPQGGIISPLLSNIALHGLENFCLKEIKSVLKRLNLPFTSYVNKIHIIRFTNDFMVIHHNLDVIIEFQKSIQHFLYEEMDLNLSTEKTFICSTLNQITINNKVIKPGFEFLGFSFKIFKSKTYPGKSSKGKVMGYRPQLKPSFKSIVSHLNELKTLGKKYRGISQSALISKLSPVISGWTLYFWYCSAKKAFSYCDNYLFQILYKWALKRHPSKSRKWVINRYFHQYKKRRWVFSYRLEGVIQKVIYSHISRKIEHYHKNSRNFSPFSLDENIKAHNLKLNKDQKSLFQRQSGYCKWCLEPIMSGDLLEIHHLLGDKNHPKREWTIYKWLIHSHCHDELHREFKGQNFPFLKQNI